MEPTTFAERLWWARRQAGIGATRLARAAGCSQSLISSLERNNSTHSKLASRFAQVLQVDPDWLATGNPAKAPKDWDAEAARRGRGAMGEPADGPPVAAIYRPKFRSLEQEARWAEGAFLAPTDGLMRGIINTFMDYARGAGPTHTSALLQTLGQLAKLIEQTSGHDEIRPLDEGNSGTD